MNLLGPLFCPGYLLVLFLLQFVTCLCLFLRVCCFRSHYGQAFIASLLLQFPIKRGPFHMVFATYAQSRRHKSIGHFFLLAFPVRIGRGSVVRVALLRRWWWLPMSFGLRTISCQMTRQSTLETSPARVRPILDRVSSHRLQVQRIIHFFPFLGSIHAFGSFP